MGVGGQRHAPAALPPGKTRYPWYRRLGGPQSRSGQVRKISPLPGFDPRTVQPIASRCNVNAIPASLFGEVRTEILYLSSDEFHRSKGCGE
jgi:hypothetical protein